MLATNRGKRLSCGEHGIGQTVAREFPERGVRIQNREKAVASSVGERAAKRAQRATYFLRRRASCFSADKSLAMSASFFWALQRFNWRSRVN